MSWISEIFSEANLWTMLVGALSNSSCAILGCYLVLRRLSLLGDAISHSVLPGIVLAYLWSQSLGTLPIVLGAMTFGLLTTFLTQGLQQLANVPEDASMGVVFTSLFALGVILIATFARGAHIDDCVLYGLIEYVSLDRVSAFGLSIPRALITLGLTLAGVVAFVLLLWKELKIVSFDPQLASAMGLSAVVIHYALMAMVALVTVTSFEAVGSILVIAMLIVPAATAHLLTDRLKWMVAWAVVVGWVSAIMGTAAATMLNTSVAGMMAVVAGIQFTLAVVCAPRYGFISKMAHTASLALRIVGEDILAVLYRQEEKGGAAVSNDEAIQAGGGRFLARLALPWLRWKGEVTFVNPRQLALTDRGRHHAQMLVRAHRLWEAYLGEHFELPLDHLHAPAERLEHFLGPALQAQLADELAKPGRDPHGKVIPPE
jgi:ABC-type Mn2+/Zn2+ transport system permease subunit/Mn-dependent DtxR family transcriptional regulator